MWVGWNEEREGGRQGRAYLYRALDKEVGGTKADLVVLWQQKPHALKPRSAPFLPCSCPSVVTIVSEYIIFLLACLSPSSYPWIRPPRRARWRICCRLLLSPSNARDALPAFDARPGLCSALLLSQLSPRIFHEVPRRSFTVGKAIMTRGLSLLEMNIVYSHTL